MNKSTGDNYHPDEEEYDNTYHHAVDAGDEEDDGGLSFDRGNRGQLRDEFSPDVRDLPPDLRDLDRVESDDDSLEVRSIRSLRLYNGSSPSKTRQNKKKKPHNAANSRQNLNQLFPELTKIRPVMKEQSKAGEEFRRMVGNSRSKATNFRTRPVRSR